MLGTISIYDVWFVTIVRKTASNERGACGKEGHGERRNKARYEDEMNSDLHSTEKVSD